MLYTVVSTNHSQAGFPLSPRPAGPWDALFRWVLCHRHPALGGCRYLRPLRCPDLWLADEVCETGHKGSAFMSTVGYVFNVLLLAWIDWRMVNNIQIRWNLCVGASHKVGISSLNPLTTELMAKMSPSLLNTCEMGFNEIMISTCSWWYWFSWWTGAAHCPGTHCGDMLCKTHAKVISVWSMRSETTTCVR